MIRSTLDRLWPVVGRVSIMYRSICRPSGDRHVDRGSIEVSIATIDRHSIAGVISTHDPQQPLKLGKLIRSLTQCFPEEEKSCVTTLIAVAKETSHDIYSSKGNTSTAAAVKTFCSHGNSLFCSPTLPDFNILVIFSLSLLDHVDEALLANIKLESQRWPKKL